LNRQNEPPGEGWLNLWYRYCYCSTLDGCWLSLFSLGVTK